MSSTCAGEPISAEEERGLRYRRERPIFVTSTVLNVVVVAAALAGVDVLSSWVASYPRLAERAAQVRTLATAAVFAPLVILALRRWRFGFVRGNAVRLSTTQFPEIHQILEEQCARLGTALPEIYLTQDARFGDARGFSHGRRDGIVLNAANVLLDHALERDVLAFLIASELGRIRLGHTKWWNEILAGYTLYVPILKNPLLKARRFSMDRYAALLAPNPVRGLLVHAAGRLGLHRVDVEEYLAQARAYRGFWARASELGQSRPHLAHRIRELERAGVRLGSEQAWADRADGRRAREPGAA